MDFVGVQLGESHAKGAKGAMVAERPYIGKLRFEAAKNDSKVHPADDAILSMLWNRRTRNQTKIGGERCLLQLKRI